MRLSGVNTMNLFGKKEKKEEAPVCACACNGNAEVKVNDLLPGLFGNGMIKAE